MSAGEAFCMILIEEDGAEKLSRQLKQNQLCSRYYCLVNASARILLLNKERITIGWQLNKFVLNCSEYAPFSHFSISTKTTSASLYFEHQWSMALIKISRHIQIFGIYFLK